MKKILYFDDDQFLTVMFEAAFKKAGFDYHAYNQVPADAEEMINLVVSEKPDCIITDIIRPNMDGLTMIKILKNDQRTKQIPIFVVSNMGEQEDIDKAKSLGASGYFVSANITPSELAEEVKIFLEK